MKNRMSNWLIVFVRERIEAIALGPFFQYLCAVRDRSDLSGFAWVHQLAHMSRDFIQALLLRAARCGRRGRDSDARFLPGFLRHAHEECMHPIDLERWAAHFGIAGIPGAPDFCGVPKTPETEALLDHLWLIAEHGAAEEQVVVMNVVAEGVALAFYRAALSCVRARGMNVGRYWRAHEEADAAHALLGVDLLDLADERSESSVRLLGLASVTLDFFEAALTSWVPGEEGRARPVVQSPVLSSTSAPALVVS